MSALQRLWFVLAASVSAAFPSLAFAQDCQALGGRQVSGEQVRSIAQKLADKRLSGLSTYFGGTRTLVLGGDGWRGIGKGEAARDICAWAEVGRFQTLVVTRNEGPEAKRFSLSETGRFPSGTWTARLAANESLDGSLAPLRYAQVWWPLKPLVLAGEWVVASLVGLAGLSWGLAIIALAAIVRLLLHPVSRFTARAQARAAEQETRLRPVLDEIKRNHKGEDAHNRVLAAHRELGIPSTYRIRPVLGSLVQIPFLVASFHLLGLMPQLEGQRFLWIDDLALPDSIAALSVSLPMMGASLNLLPFAMAASIVGAGYLAVPPAAEAAVKARKRRNTWLTAAVFFVLLYPFPAALLLYWTATNLFQLVEARFVGQAAP